MWRHDPKHPKPYHVVEYASCPFCNAWSIGVQANGRIVRHSIGFGYVEKVGPGTRHPLWRTTICERGSGYLLRPHDAQPGGRAGRGARGMDDHV